MSDGKELRPFDEVMKQLVRHCLLGGSGYMYVFSDRKNVALFEMVNGKIIDIVYRARNGLEVIPYIKEMTVARYYFNNSSAEGIRSKKNNVNTTNEQIFELLGIQSVDSIARELKKILVVEDSGVIRKSIVQILEENKYNVFEAKDGAEAMMQLNREQPDLVLLDLILPKIDGYEVLSQMKKNPDLKDIPVIVLTSRDTLFDKLKGKMSGSDEYLTKPFEKEELLARIDKHIKLKLK